MGRNRQDGKDYSIWQDVRQARRSLTFARAIESEVAAPLQTKIDALMLEYCHEEMTPEQVANWALCQIPVSDEDALSDSEAQAIATEGVNPRNAPQ